MLGGGGGAFDGGGSEDGVEFEGEGRWENGGGAGNAEREGFRVEGRKGKGGSRGRHGSLYFLSRCALGEGIRFKGSSGDLRVRR